MSDVELIKKAIREKKSLRFEYEGHVREVSPHALGWKGSSRRMIVYQFGGTSSRGRIVPGSRDNWRCMELAKVRNLKIINARWQTHNSHSRRNTCIDRIEIEVDGRWMR